MTAHDSQIPPKRPPKTSSAVLIRGIGVISLALSLLIPASVQATEPQAPASPQDECAQLGQLYLQIQSHKCDLQVCQNPAERVQSATVRGQRAWANSQCAAPYDGVFERYKAVCGIALDYNSTTFEELGKVLRAYQEAYLCTPGIEHADYLYRALWRIASAKESLEAAQAKFAADEPAKLAVEAKFASLTLRENELSALLPPQPQAAIETKDNPPVKLPSEIAAKPASAPLARAYALLEMLSLRMVGGFGGAKELNLGSGFIRRKGPAYGFGIFGGLHLGIGHKKRHIIEAGAEYIVIQQLGAALLSPRGEDCGAPTICGLAPAMQYLSTSLGYGYRIRKDHLLVRARAGVGFHVLAMDPGFGKRFGLVAVSVCSVWEVLCVSFTGRGSGGLFSSTHLTSGLATLEVDLLRIPAAFRAVPATHTRAQVASTELKQPHRQSTRP